MSATGPGRLSEDSADQLYRRFFELFNRGEFFQAHEVLETLWLTVRNEPIGDFYKGLIQLAGAFVHVQKQRRGPALSLLRLADQNLARYPAHFENLDLGNVREIIGQWETILVQAAGQANAIQFPTLTLLE